MSANEAGVKTRGSDLERAADNWTEYAELLASEAEVARDQMGKQMSREYSEYARGCAAGLREALRILAREA
jgi:cyclopropane fatty-acyl-phospholipid synthase-like methyltransferase